MEKLLMFNAWLFAFLAGLYGLGALGVLPPARDTPDAAVCGIAFAAAVGFFAAWRATHRVATR